MNDSNNISADMKQALIEPRIEQAGPLLVAGLREPLDQNAAQRIPKLWQQLTSGWDLITQRVDNVGYGVCIHLRDHEYYYMAACTVWDFTGLDASLSPFIIPSQTYAVFSHSGSVQTIRTTLILHLTNGYPHPGIGTPSRKRIRYIFLSAMVKPLIRTQAQAILKSGCRLRPITHPTPYSRVLRHSHR